MYEVMRDLENIEIADDYASKSIEAMTLRERKALQRDINAIRAQNKLPPIATDGIVGPKTKEALEDI